MRNYINEVLVHGNFGKNLIHYTCQPETKEELQKIIKERLEKDGSKCNLNDIDVSQINDMSCLFDASNFNGDISEWDVSNVVNMERMFCGCWKFNSDISKWDVSNVKVMREMFLGCGEFNCDISGWDISNVDSMFGMFKESGFNQDISNWDVHDAWCGEMFACCPIKEKNKPKITGINL